MTTYSTATARIVLDADGIYTDAGTTLVGKVVVNVTDGEVRSVGVYDRSTGKTLVRLRPETVKSKNLLHGSRAARSIVDAFLR